MDPNNNNNNNSTTITSTTSTVSEKKQEISLFEAFRIGQRIYVGLEDSQLSANDAEYQKLVKDAISKFLVSNLYINNDSVFSKNEELEDIRTDLLKYLLVPYYLSELFLKIIDGSRVKNLKMAKMKIMEFLHRMEKLEIIDKEDLAVIQREGKTDPLERRNELISRGKRDKELKEKLKYIVKKREDLLKNQSGEIDDEMEDCGDEELERSFITALLQDAISKGISSLETIEVELPMLIEIEVLKDKHGGVLPPQAPPKSSGIGNFQILPDGRRVMLDKVFRPSHILPTMTPQEAVELEMHNGGMVKGKGGAQSSVKNQESDDEDDKEESHEELIKKRNWDDFKDDNKRGWGNKRNFG
ncbi:hypothetical protein DLAC_10397 [Tieghemostelium lacteum]|uniref:TAP42 family protein n=1 Tax=Tieghemostelium lacteum TaxID=361077 RepID=A0A151Z5E5_TIELA|nr:hypothetical protein DLAC_10397 [Tieghemostelium lacteum]|eukprot:KYQ89155.1 hypothetical protein DLAC_10397 [Tieghemostelium lacteum]